MMMLKIGQLCYLHLKNFKGGWGGESKNLIYFWVPKTNSYTQACNSNPLYGQTFPIPNKF